MNTRFMSAIFMLTALHLGCSEDTSQTCATNADCFKGEVCSQATRLCGSPLADMDTPDLDRPAQADGPLAAPTQLAVMPTSRGTLELSWAPVPGAARYQVKIVEAGEQWQDSSISPGWEDLAPPQLTLAVGQTSASQGAHLTHVALLAQPIARADSRRYLVRAIDPEGMPGAETGVEGALTAQILSFTWEVARQTGVFTPLAGATSASFEDVEGAEGGTRYLYRVHISGPGITPVVSEPVEGWRRAPAVVQLMASSEVSCVLFEHGKVRCWGAARLTGAQRGESVHIVDPSEVGDLELGGAVAQLFGGNNNLCAIMKEDGAVRCWGENKNAQLGAPTVALGDTVGDEPGEMPPSAVPLPEAAIAGDAGLVHACVIGVSGKIYCWGKNTLDKGQLGDIKKGDTFIGDQATDFDTLSPVELPNFKANKIVIGSEHTCATGQDTRDNILKSYCWGSNSSGQLGAGNLYSYGSQQTVESIVPWPPPELKHSNGMRLTTLSAGGGGYTCALYNTDVTCWGSGELGQLAKGDTRNLHTPGPRIELGGPVRDISTGSAHVCAHMAAGEVRCWGLNRHGELGTGNNANWGDDATETMKPPAVALEGGLSIKDISAGGQHTCVLFEDDQVRCWGDNPAKQLGFSMPTKLGDRPDTLPNDPKYNVPLLKK